MAGPVIKAEPADAPAAVPAPATAASAVAAPPAAAPPAPDRPAASGKRKRDRGLAHSPTTAWSAARDGSRSPSLSPAPASPPPPRRRHHADAGTPADPSSAAATATATAPRPPPPPPPAVLPVPLPTPAVAALTARANPPDAPPTPDEVPPTTDTRSDRKPVPAPAPRPSSAAASPPAPPAPGTGDAAAAAAATAASGGDGDAVTSTPAGGTEPNVDAGLDILQRKDTHAIQEESKGLVRFQVVRNDGTDHSMVILTGLKNIFMKQLPKMPKEYITRLVYDKTHVSMAVIRYPLKVLGGITYRLFEDRHFAEIVFCAIASTEQVQGYGSRLMSHVKDYVTTTNDARYFLTYADNYAIGYFKKQGFTTDITLAKSVWMGYIKDYEGGTIMQCSILPRVRYLEAKNIIMSQRRSVFQDISGRLNPPTVFPGLAAFKDPNCKSVDPAAIPGLAEAGWVPTMGESPMSELPKPRNPHYMFFRKMLQEMRENKDVWPFVEPVSGVADYYDIIKEPMSVRNLEENVEADLYPTIDAFVAAAQLIFDNCRTYNEDGTPYVKCANRLEKWFKERLKSARAESGFA